MVSTGGVSLKSSGQGLIVSTGGVSVGSTSVGMPVNRSTYRVDFLVQDQV